VRHAAIAGQVNLSPSAVRRRLKAMRAHGIIMADVAMVDPARQSLTFIVQVYFEREDPQTIAAFVSQMQSDTRVSQCYSVSGDCDFWLVVHAQTPQAFEAWGQTELMSNAKIRRYSTSLVWSRQVFQTAVSVG
jgi:Lrp/AsnC family transcriptional regulator, leucine-responsive regulatory protein